jgi:gliding motility-associated protein GldE
LDSDDYYPDLILRSVFFEPVASAVISLAGIFILLFCLCLIAAGERVLLSLSPDETEALRNEHTSGRRSIRQLLSEPQQTLLALTVARSFAHVLCVLLGIYSLSLLIGSFTGQVVIYLYVLLGWMILGHMAGGLVPKLMMRNRMRLIHNIAPFIAGIDRILKPVTRTVLSPATSGSKKRTASGELSIITKDPADEKEMLDEITHFYHKRADEIMVPRLDMEAADIRCSFGEVKKILIRTGFSRIPVYAETEDNIRGILYGKDVLPAAGNPDTFSWQSLIRPAYFVPETKKIDALLEEFRSRRIHIAIVVDEFGCTSGLVTLEDIIEEIVGEIADEYDDDEKLFFKLPDGNYIFEGKIQLNDFFRETDIDPGEFGEMAEEAETLAGLLLEINGVLPRRRETVEYKNYRFRILEANERRVLKIKFSLAEPGKKE